MFEAFRKMLRPVETRLANMVARAVLKSVDDSKRMQLVQLGVLTDETRDEVERVQNYGFTSRPKVGAEAVVLFMGGRRDHGLVIAVDDRRYRLIDLVDGEVAMYDHTGSSIVMKSNGDIEITPSSGLVTMAGDLDVDGTVTATTDVIGGNKSLKNHTHPAGALSSPSGAVTGTTGAPS